MQSRLQHSVQAFHLVEVLQFYTRVFVIVHTFLTKRATLERSVTRSILIGFEVNVNEGK